MKSIIIRKMRTSIHKVESNTKIDKVDNKISTEKVEEPSSEIQMSKLFTSRHRKFRILFHFQKISTLNPLLFNGIYNIPFSCGAICICETSRTVDSRCLNMNVA